MRQTLHALARTTRTSFRRTLAAIVFGAGCARAPQAAAPAPARDAATSAATDSTLASNAREAQALLTSLGARSSEPAEQVFKNVQWLKGVSASTFLTIMNVGYARALGVRCRHCHVADDYSSDAKRPKRAAREMAVMHRGINDQLRAMTNLATMPTERRNINCMTCHRGRVNPNAP